MKLDLEFVFSIYCSDDDYWTSHVFLHMMDVLFVWRFGKCLLPERSSLPPLFPFYTPLIRLLHLSVFLLLSPANASTVIKTRQKGNKNPKQD